MEASRKKESVMNTWLSLIPGIGHVYLGQGAKGFTYALVAVGLIHLVSRGEGPLGLLIPVYWIFVMLDANRSALEINQAIERGETTVRSSAWPPWSGGVVIGLGVLFLLSNFDLIDFEWIWRLWPVALIVIGVKLIRPGSAAKTVPAPPAVPDSTDTSAGEAVSETRGEAEGPESE
jgi:hypothetical protein